MEENKIKMTNLEKIEINLKLMDEQREKIDRYIELYNKAISDGEEISLYKKNIRELYDKTRDLIAENSILVNLNQNAIYEEPKRDEQGKYIPVPQRDNKIKEEKKQRDLYKESLLEEIDSFDWKKRPNLGKELKDKKTMIDDDMTDIDF